MTAVQAVIVVGGSLLLLTAMIAGMIRANQSERRYMERRREEWIAGGRIPEEEPNFYSGSDSSSGS
jgi:tRNA A37 N6-isopentenylltransferase MiaA